MYLLTKMKVGCNRVLGELNEQVAAEQPGHRGLEIAAPLSDDCGQYFEDDSREHEPGTNADEAFESGASCGRGRSDKHSAEKVSRRGK